MTDDLGPAQSHQEGIIQPLMETKRMPELHPVLERTPLPAVMKCPPCSRPWDDASHHRHADPRHAAAWRGAPPSPERVSNPGRAHLARAFNQRPTQPSPFLPFHRLDVPNVTAPRTSRGVMKPQRLAAAWHGQCVCAGLEGDRRPFARKQEPSNLHAPD
jgi:hypothetical protein